MKIQNSSKWIPTLAALVLTVAGLWGPQAAAQTPAPASAKAPPSAPAPLAFYVVNQRTLTLTAEYWNPIVSYVSKKSGVPLALRLAKNPTEGNSNAEKGAYDFLYTNHMFTPERDALGFQVLARPVGPGIQAQIVVPSDSPARTLQDLEGKEVGFVSRDGFVGYHVPLDALLRAKVNVKIVITGNQEASVAQLKIGKIAGAGVNGLILERYAAREGFAYRSLWTSAIYPDLCVMAHKRVTAEQAAAVKQAFIGMDKDKDGIAVLAAAATLIKANSKLGYVEANDRDYDGYRAFFKTSLVKK